MCRVSRYKDKVHPCLCAPVRDCLVQEHAQRRGHVGLAGITVLVLVAVKIRAVVADVRVQLLANVGPARLLPEPLYGAVSVFVFFVLIHVFLTNRCLLISKFSCKKEEEKGDIPTLEMKKTSNEKETKTMKTT